MKIAFVDTYYKPVLKDVTLKSYRERLCALMSMYFGTAFYYSDAFRRMGWESVDIVANDDAGRMLWCKEAGLTYDENEGSVIDELAMFEPDIVYMQDLSFFKAQQIRSLKQRMGWKFVAQHSCPWAGDDQVSAFDCVFTSFPHYIPRIAKLGVQTSLLPIAFGHQVLEALKSQQSRSPAAFAAAARAYTLSMPRHFPITFVGGLNGTNGHWTKGTEMMERIAEDVPQFKWWGYFIGEGDQYPALKAAYQGPAWGLDMYRIYAQSQIVINRHGEVAEGYANNMRMFEATGCGALLVTEAARNLTDYFVLGKECITYNDPEHAVGLLKQLVWTPEVVQDIAEAGQAKTLACHTYDRRLSQIEPFLQRVAISK